MGGKGEGGGLECCSEAIPRRVLAAHLALPNLSLHPLTPPLPLNRHSSISLPRTSRLWQAAPLSPHDLQFSMLPTAKPKSDAKAPDTSIFIVLDEKVTRIEAQLLSARPITNTTFYSLLRYSPFRARFANALRPPLTTLRPVLISPGPLCR